MDEMIEMILDINYRYFFRDYLMNLYEFGIVYLFVVIIEIKKFFFVFLFLI